MEPIDLPDGLVLRSATAADAEQIPGFSADAHGENERHATAVLLRGPLGEPGPDDLPLTQGRDDWTVVVDGERVVSTCALFRHRLRIADQIVPVGQIEYVATAPSHQRRGLVRQQVDLLHQRSAARGDLLQLISGIPHYYRRLGYGYGLDWPERFAVAAAVDGADGFSIRPAAAGDLDALAALHDEAQQHVAIAVLRPRTAWAALIAEGPAWNDSVFVAEAGGEVAGSMRYVTWPEEPVAEIVEATATTIAAGTALLAAARAKAGAGALCAFDRPGTPYSAALRAVGQPTERWHPTYVRLPDPLAVLHTLRPVLQRRLAASTWAAERGELVLSWFESAARISYADGEITAFEPDAPIEDPEVTADTGIAPDSLAALLLGRFGALTLERRTDDVLLGRHRDLMAVLFPRMANEHTFAI